MRSKTPAAGFLDGIRVIEVADELGEFCGKMLAALGADVVKIEPPEGERTRGYGPYAGDVPDSERSLYFWAYNLGKRSVIADLDSPAGRELFADLVKSADVVLDARQGDALSGRGFGYQALKALKPDIVLARITPFGDDGPWAHFTGSDLVHLALGGVMMNCGYDPEPDGHYDTPPVAPQMWQAYHIAGQLMTIAVIAALAYRAQTGVGQELATAVHECVSKNTETDVPNWTYLAQPHFRMTCRHSMPAAASRAPTLAATKDGRWVLAYNTYLPGSNAFENTVTLLKGYGLQGDLEEDRYADEAVRASPHFARHVGHLVADYVSRFKFTRDTWLEAQAQGLTWAPVRRPEENLADSHWSARGTFAEVSHPEIGRSLKYVAGPWRCPEVPWRTGPRAPLAGEHTRDVISELAAAAPAAARTAAPAAPLLGPTGQPFALAGVRIIDLSWLLASAGAGRFFTALGAEVIKVEHSSRWDSMRWGAGTCPSGGRAEREGTEGPLRAPAGNNGPNRSGVFMEINAGKRGISLNLKHPRGRQLLEELIRDADMVVEGFSPGTMKRMGLSYERLREINPRIIYVQQSGCGEHGSYGPLRAFGPTAAAMAGISDMSGLPEPYPPAGIGYSYLDWFGAYNMALAMMAALYRQRTTGKGCHIDASQVETGLALTGSSILDAQVNHRAWTRYGNRSPYKPAAPHGVYRTRGEDRWLAIACFDEAAWLSLTEVLGAVELRHDDRFRSLAARLLHQDELDAAIEAATLRWGGYQLMDALQAKGVAAGVCQTAADRCECDPQLSHLNWRTELPQAEIGTWPVKNDAVSYSMTPSFAGGFLGRSGPNYGEDNEYVYTKILGLSEDEIGALAADGVI